MQILKVFQNPKQSYTNKYQKCFACSYSYELVKDTQAKMQFNILLKLVIIKEDNEDLKNSTRRWICDNNYIDNDVKVRDLCHITGKYKGSTHRDCNINLKSNHKIPVVIQNLKNYDSHLITQELVKFSLKLNVI